VDERTLGCDSDRTPALPGRRRIRATGTAYVTDSWNNQAVNDAGVTTAGTAVTGLLTTPLSFEKGLQPQPRHHTEVRRVALSIAARQQFEVLRLLPATPYYAGNHRATNCQR
jgi:hypothetical protein